MGTIDRLLMGQTLGTILFIFNPETGEYEEASGTPHKAQVAVDSLQFPGGEIVVSPTVTKKAPEGADVYERILTWIRNNGQTILNRMRSRSTITDVVEQVPEKVGYVDAVGFTIIRGVGRYVSPTEKVSKETSYTIIIKGVPDYVLQYIGEAIGREFNQSGVLITYYDTMRSEMLYI